MIIDGKTIYPAKFKGKIYQNYGIDEDGNVYNITRGTKLKPYITPNGYYQIMLYSNGSSVIASLHHLVYESITGVNPTSVHKEIDHLDGDKANNKISNLDLVTHAENVHRSIKMGKHLIYKQNITREAAIKICELLQEGKTAAEIIRLTGYSASWVRGIMNREYCLEISKDYTWNLEAVLGVTIPDSVIHNICKDIAKGELSLRAIARKYGISPTMVMDLRHGKRRSDITSQYDFSGKSDTEKLNLGPHEVAKPYVTKDGKPTNLIVTSSGRFFRTGTLKEQNPAIQHKDLCVSVKIDDGPKRNIPCKKIVAETFCENPYGFRDIINIDGNLYNLYPSNLKYVPHDVLCKQMMDTKVRRSYDGMNNSNAKITEDDVYSILHLYHDSNMKPKKIAKLYGLTKEAVVHICEGKSWFKQYSYFMNEKFKSAKKYNNQPLKIRLGTK